MTALLNSTRAEVLRLRRWPALWVLLGVWITLDVTFGYVFNWIAYRSGGSSPVGGGVPYEVLRAGLLPSAAPVAVVQGMPMFGGALLMILGALTVGSGYGWGTWKTVFTQGPSRGTAFGGTLLALAGVVACVVVVSAGVNLGISCAISAIEGLPMDLPSAGDWLQALGTGLLVIGMWTAAGALVGVLARSPALATGLGLVWALVIENLLRGVSGLLAGISAVTDHLPGTAAGSLVGAFTEGRPIGDGAPGVFQILGGTSAAIWLTAYLAGFVVVAVLVVRRRDVA